MTDAADKTASYWTVMKDPTSSPWLKYWLLMAWETRSEKESVDDPRRLLQAITNKSVLSVLVQDDLAYWLRRALVRSQELEHALAVRDAATLLEILVEREKGQHHPNERETPVTQGATRPCH